MGRNGHRVKKTVEYVVKERIIPAKKVPAKKKQRTKVICDICGKDVDTSRDNHYCSGESKCDLCHRDICRREKSNGEGTCMIFDPNGWEDCVDRFCPICYELKFKKYWAEYEKMLEEADLALEKFKERLKQESLSVVPKV